MKVVAYGALIGATTFLTMFRKRINSRALGALSMLDPNSKHLTY